MKHKRHHALHHIKKKYKGLAAAVAAAAILSGTVAPGMPAAVAHASPNSGADNPAAASQQVDTKAPTNAKQELSIKATAYAPGPHDNDQWGNKTFTGTDIRPGVVAVDPDVIPLGSKLLIQYPDGHFEHGVAQDTGGAIKGNRIDVAKSNVKEAQDFGIQNVKVFVLSSPKEV